MKKTYMNPEMDVVELKTRHALLTLSSDDKKVFDIRNDMDAEDDEDAL